MIHYSAHFSHEFEKGHSGPARSYWTLRNAGNVDIGTVCLHHRSELDAEAQVNSLLYLLDQAHEAGEAAMQRKIRKAIGL